MRNITFPEFCEIMNNADAVILDNNALSYPYVESYEDEDGNTGYDRVEINYMSDYAQIENSFYSDDTNVTILDDGSIKVKANDEFYNIQVLSVVKL